MERTPTFRERRSARIALAVGLALIAIAIAVRLARPPLVVAGTNSVPGETPIAVTRGSTSGCQEHEALPGGTTAIRLWISVNIGPRVSLTAFSGSRVVARGTRTAGWTGEFATIPIQRIPRTISPAKICFALGPGLEKIGLLGARASNRASGEAPKMRIEYMRPGSRSWWSLASSVLRRMGLGRSPSGTWIALLPLLLMAAAAVLAAWLILRQLGSSRGTPRAPIAGAQTVPLRAGNHDSVQARRSILSRPALRLRAALGRVPTAAWGCACVAFLSAASWSIVTPPFQVVDEPSHFAYAQVLAETGRLPTSGESRYSEAELAVLEDLHHLEVRFNPAVGAISSPSQQGRLEEALAQHLSRGGEGDAGVASTEPPLYYALQTIPYRLASGGNLLDQLALMRLLSALLAGVTGLFAFLFLRETLPAIPWAWTVGGLGVALFPLLGFMSGAVNPESMLSAVAAVLFYCLARAFRRGLTPRLAVAIGTVTAVGFLTKLNFIGLAPGIALALIFLARRAARTSGRSAYRSLAIAVAIAATPVCLYALINILSNHPGLGLASANLKATGEHSLSSELSYIWQLYLPRLPGMPSDFPGIFSTRQIWFDRSVGLYGWLDTYFPPWVYNVALIPAGAILALCACALIRGRSALQSRLPELVVYLVIGIGVLVVVGAASYVTFPRRSGAFAEPRYLLPLAALFGAVFALAARGAGRRWGPAVGALIVVLILGYDIFSQLLIVSRYYG
jgi:hypothetical protein